MQHFSMVKEIDIEYNHDKVYRKGEKECYSNYL